MIASHNTDCETPLITSGRNCKGFEIYIRNQWTPSNLDPGEENESAGKQTRRTYGTELVVDDPLPHGFHLARALRHLLRVLLSSFHRISASSLFRVLFLSRSDGGKESLSGSCYIPALFCVQALEICWNSVSIHTRQDSFHMVCVVWKPKFSFSTCFLRSKKGSGCNFVDEKTAVASSYV